MHIGNTQDFCFDMQRDPAGNLSGLAGFRSMMFRAVVRHWWCTLQLFSGGWGLKCSGGRLGQSCVKPPWRFFILPYPTVWLPIKQFLYLSSSCEHENSSFTICTLFIVGSV